MGPEIRFRTYKLLAHPQDKIVDKQLPIGPFCRLLLRERDFALPSISLILLRYAVLTYHIVEIFNYY
jgi:hypothetical protein